MIALEPTTTAHNLYGHQTYEERRVEEQTIEIEGRTRERGYVMLNQHLDWVFIFQVCGCEHHDYYP